jgi:hypothetical protein
MIPQIVGKIPRYDCGTGTIVVIPLCFDEPSRDVHVDIWALRSTVSSGNLIERSRAELAKVTKLQLAGFMAGSKPR